MKHVFIIQTIHLTSWANFSVFHPEMKSKKDYGIDTSDPASKKAFLLAFNFDT